MNSLQDVLAYLSESANWENADTLPIDGNVEVDADLSSTETSLPAEKPLQSVNSQDTEEEDTTSLVFVYTGELVTEAQHLSCMANLAEILIGSAESFGAWEATYDSNDKVVLTVGKIYKDIIPEFKDLSNTEVEQEVMSGKFNAEVDGVFSFTATAGIAATLTGSENIEAAAPEVVEPAKPVQEEITFVVEEVEAPSKV